MIGTSVKGPEASDQSSAFPGYLLSAPCLAALCPVIEGRTQVVERLKPLERLELLPSDCCLFPNGCCQFVGTLNGRCLAAQGCDERGRSTVQCLPRRRAAFAGARSAARRSARQTGDRAR